jgi:hypothetical protein
MLPAAFADRLRLIVGFFVMGCESCMLLIVVSLWSMRRREPDH